MIVFENKFSAIICQTQQSSIATATLRSHLGFCRRSSRFWEENLSVFLFSVFRFQFSVFRLIGFCRRSSRFWEENLSVFFVFRFPLSVLRFPFDRLLPPFELVVIGNVDGGEMCLLRRCFLSLRGAKRRGNLRFPLSVFRFPFSEGGHGATN